MFNNKLLNEDRGMTSALLDDMAEVSRILFYWENMVQAATGKYFHWTKCMLR